MIDQWNGGCRNDDASFDFFSNWWVENRQFLTYYRQRWRVRKPGQKHPSGSEPSAENELAKDPRKQFME
ncbi:MAG: hypothetical protein U5N86_01900 [Planctomycetota bacterium]|nr:hypothetical protein [Planctomycetota bacterium]